jgi:hypothetical protein
LRSQRSVGRLFDNRKLAAVGWRKLVTFQARNAGGGRKSAGQKSCKLGAVVGESLDFDFDAAGRVSHGAAEAELGC